jgi:hypothetical protein
MTNTVFWTILTGVSVFVLGQWIVKGVIEPIQELRRTIGEIAFALSFHANIYMNPGSDSPEYHSASRQLRELSCRLKSDVRIVPFYSSIRWLVCLPTLANLERATKGLIFLSNGVYSKPDRLDWNEQKADEVAQALGIGDRKTCVSSAP